MVGATGDRRSGVRGVRVRDRARPTILAAALLLATTLGAPTTGAAAPGPTQSGLVATPAPVALLVAVPVAPPGGGKEEAAARAAVKTYKSGRRNASPAASLRQYIYELDLLKAHDSPVVVDVVLDELEQGLPERQRRLRGVLGGFTRVETLDYLVRHGLDHSRSEVREQVALALGEGRPAGYDWVTPLIMSLDDPTPRVRAAAVEVLGRARVAESLGAILELAPDTSVRVRQRVPEALARLAPKRALPMLSSMASDSSWRVRVSVVRALGTLKSRGSVEALIDVLEHEQGRVREDALNELRNLTRQNFGMSVEAWRRYLEIAPQDFLSNTAVDGADPSASPGSVVYYGLSSLSTRFVMVTDLSGSMSTYEGASAIPTQRATRTGTRLDLTTRELTALLEHVETDVSLNLLTFTSGVKSWKNKLVPMHDKQRQRALQELESYRADGPTNVYAALETCFDMAAPSLDRPEREDETPDTIFLLTDGVPSEGRLQDPNFLLEYIGERNRDLQLRIHCISLTTLPAALEFMERIARLTTGQAVTPFGGSR